MIHKFKMQRSKLEEVELEIEYPAGTSEAEMEHRSRLALAKTPVNWSGWKLYSTYDMKYVDSTFVDNTHDKIKA